MNLTAARKRARAKAAKAARYECVRKRRAWGGLMRQAWDLVELAGAAVKLMESQETWEAERREREAEITRLLAPFGIPKEVAGEPGGYNYASAITGTWRR